MPRKKPEYKVRITPQEGVTQTLDEILHSEKMKNIFKEILITKTALKSAQKN
ncbi:hypothetical protein [Oceanobacillus kimchii]|uniref:Uncharacterized protein n=1 Tax=Oceanobacillus kimchii TaxID=746691 RepID=A0ABQ5TL17_9BACI|nr:hypothetical protein [Oceanobacillus kimchii]GLO66289.1 hypothetical protein MACH08_20730 [Oceanobacillus kimchii]